MRLSDYVVEQLGDPGGMLIVGETGFVKEGAKSAGVQRQNGFRRRVTWRAGPAAKSRGKACSTGCCLRSLTMPGSGSDCGPEGPQVEFPEVEFRRSLLVHLPCTVRG